MIKNIVSFVWGKAGLKTGYISVRRQRNFKIYDKAASFLHFCKEKDKDR